jgi:hypothetical protein
MNICIPGKKKELWARLKKNLPEIAEHVERITKAFPGEYKVIDIKGNKNETT